LGYNLGVMVFDVKKKRLIYLFVYFWLACLAVFIFRPYYLYSILIVLVPPSIANFIWLKNSRTKVLLFSLLAVILFAPPIELATRLANVWDVQSIFGRPFGLVPLENMLFAFLNFFWVLCFYEYFVDKDKNKKISKNIKYIIGLFIVLSAFVYGLYYFNKNLITANYFLMSVPVLIIPSILIFYKNPKLLKKTILPTLFFAVVFFIYEVISLQIGSWWWPGQYFYSFNLFGKIFPLDDVIIWYFLSTPTLIGGYEFFADDFR